MIRYIYIAKAEGCENIYKVGMSSAPVERVESLKGVYDCAFELMYFTKAYDHRAENLTHKFLQFYKSDYFGVTRREIFDADYGHILNAVKVISSLLPSLPPIQGERPTTKDRVLEFIKSEFARTGIVPDYGDVARTLSGTDNPSAMASAMGCIKDLKKDGAIVTDLGARPRYKLAREALQ